MSQFGKIGHLLQVAVWGYLRPYWGLHLVLALAVVVTVTFEICFPITIKFLIDAALIPHDLRNLVTGLVILVVLFASSHIAQQALAVINAYMLKEICSDLRVALIRLMQRLPMSYFDRVQPGHFSPLFDTELLTLGVMLKDLCANGFYAGLKFVVIMVAMYVLNWQLALAVTLMLPLMVLLPQRGLKTSVDSIDQLRKGVETINGAVMDHVSSQALVRAFGRGEAVSNRLIADVARAGSRAALRRFSDVRRTLQTPHFLINAFRKSVDAQHANLTLLVIGVGASLSFAHVLTLGTFSAFILLLPTLKQATSQLAKYVQDLSRATLSLDRLEQIEHAAAPAVDAGTLIDLQVPRHSIRFDQVHFSYAEGKAYIRDLNLTLPIGRSVAFVGRSGCGKSTLFKLLLGFFDPAAGRVLIDDQDLRGVSPASLGSHIGTVLQQSVLLNTSIRNNICFARPQASDEEIIQAARLAGIHDFVVTLPKGYESGVGEGGKWLSEGQKQRIALARAILPDPAILLLDEVTAALDPESEAAVNATIERLAERRTVILVTHRLASVRFVDHLVVIDQGQVQEQGRHDELLARAGLYQRLWQMQSGFVVSGDGHRAEVQGERLQAIPLFRDVAIATLNALAAQFVSEFHPAGDSIYREGEPGDKFFIIVRGTVSVSTRNAGNQAIRLAALEDGDYFGEGEMLNRGRRSTTVTATTPSLVLALRAEQFNAMVNELSLLNKVVTQMALGRSLSTICSVGRRRRSHAIWQGLVEHAWI